MQPFEIFIIYISWENGGKNRPVLIMECNADIVKVFSITTQYQSKSGNMQAKYLEIKDWQKAGLNKPSYIDVNRKIDLPSSLVLGKTPIGHLTILDKQRLIEFLK